MDDFLTIVTHCKGGVTLEVNEHRNNYQTVEEFLADIACMNDTLDDLPAEVRAEMVARDTVVHLQFYPQTPVGSYSIYHYDVQEAVAMALSLLP